MAKAAAVLPSSTKTREYEDYLQLKEENIKIISTKRREYEDYLN